VTVPPPPARPASLEIIVPAHNEAARLPAGLAALCEKAASLPVPVSVLVVDNASTDSTADIVRAWPDGPVPVRLLHCPRLGKGAAVRAGLLASRAPFVGFCDADMATDLSALDTVLGLFADGHQVVIGSRALHTSVVDDHSTATRRFGAIVFRTLARAIAPGVTDTQCGFKFFTGPLARRAALPLRSTGFIFDAELLAICQRAGARVIEIPVRWQDVAGSKFSPRRHSAAIFRDMVSIWLRTRAFAGVTDSWRRVPPPDRELLPSGVTTR
jgi:dolichyl-phosphate beta-glucosyltransferase